MIRKTIGLATITLQVRQYQAPPSPLSPTPIPTPTSTSPPPSTSAEEAGTPVTHIDIDQTLTGGLQGNAERRCLDWEARAHSDWLFGGVRGRSRWISAADLRGWVADEYGAYLRGGPEDGEWLEPGGDGGEPAGGPAGETHVLNHVQNVDEGRGWSAAQVWGFQRVGGERRYVRNLVVADAGGANKVCIKMVYDYVSD